ncbi:hypothetical protein IG528_17555 [Vibrio cholerae]|uniref:DUF6036 family nucleotidyltransferase n=1 Tax=Vibrio cholerae TaxID=666 RepID=UPI00053C2CCD|nr:DUF6036 family nucleotidyltransferase [Vibrio cholerae]EJL6339771.1 hypothetical protein [Vibrio cholerae]MCX9515156.1 hypothetical protein [Vibrio cholerae]MCX9518695.1 hypothetical protein [Vibrio cholerae]
MTDLHTETPLAKAIFELFDDLAQLIEEKHGDLPAGSIKAYVFGGCAVHLYTNARGSNDLDAELNAANKLDISSIILELDPVYFDDPEVGESTLDWDANFNIGLPSLSPDYKENAIPLVCGDSILHIYLVSAVDIAVSKLSRLAEDDLKDIIALFKAKRFSLEDFKQVAQDAIDYSATPDSLQSNVEFAITAIEEA